MLPYVPPHESPEPARCPGGTHIYGWTVRSADLSGDHERFDVATRRVLIDYPDDEDWMLAHVRAHLDLGHVTPDSAPFFTQAQEDHADALAELRFDMDSPRDVWELPAMDGEPTLGRTL